MNEAAEVLALIFGTVGGIKKDLKRRLKEAESFRDMLADANVNGTLDMKLATATGRVEALYEFEKDLDEIMKEVGNLGGVTEADLPS